MPKEEFINSDGIKLHYIDWKDTRRPMVLLAGLSDAANIYHSLAPKLRTGSEWWALPAADMADQLDQTLDTPSIRLSKIFTIS